MNTDKKKFVPDTQANAAHNSCLEGLASLVESVVAQHGEDTTTTTEPIFFSNMRLEQLTQAEKVSRKQCSGSVRSLVVLGYPDLLVRGPDPDPFIIKQE